MKIERESAASLVAVIENDLRAIAELDRRLAQFSEVEERDAATVAYALHNIYSALENSFDQISRTFENHIVDTTKWHRELLTKMFLEIPGVRPAVLTEESRSILHELLRFRHLFRHSYDFRLDAGKLLTLTKQWQEGRAQVSNNLNEFARKLLEQSTTR